MIGKDFYQSATRQIKQSFCRARFASVSGSSSEYTAQRTKSCDLVAADLGTFAEYDDGLMIGFHMPFNSFLWASRCASIPADVLCHTSPRVCSFTATNPKTKSSFSPARRRYGMLDIHFALKQWRRSCTIDSCCRLLPHPPPRKTLHLPNLLLLPMAANRIQPHHTQVRPAAVNHIFDHLHSRTRSLHACLPIRPMPQS